VAGLVAAAVSVFGSWIPSLWGDEAASLMSAQRSLPSLFAMLAHVDAVHGLYYLLLHFWIHLAGTSPFAIRLPSALAIGVAAAAVTWMCGRMRSLRLAVLAGAITAVLPRLTLAGEEARPYAFDAAICAVLFALVAEIVLAGDRRRRLWTVYGALLVLGTYMFLYDLLVAVAVGAFLLVTPGARRHLKRWALATGCAVVACCPLLVAAFLERAQIAYLQDQPEVTPESVLVTMWFGSVPFAIVAWAGILLAAAGVIMQTLRRRRGTLPSAPVGGDVAVLAFCWLVLPMGILIAASPLVSGFTARYATMAAPAAAVLIAAGIDTALRRSAVAIVAAGAVVLTAVPVWASLRTAYAMNQSDWNEIAAVIHSHARPGDGIVFDEGVRPSRRTRLAMDTDPAAFSAVKDVALRSPYTQNDTWYDHAYSVRQAAALGRFHDIDRVWVVEYSIDGQVYRWGISSLEAMGYHLTTHYTEHSSVIYLFTR
jgi:mannosyltransferase